MHSNLCWARIPCMVCMFLCQNDIARQPCSFETPVVLKLKRKHTQYRVSAPTFLETID